MFIVVSIKHCRSLPNLILLEVYLTSNDFTSEYPEKGAQLRR